MSLKRAIAYAKTHHAGQRRMTGEPYVEHSRRVLKILERCGLDEEILIAAVLHDVNEDTDSTNLDINKMFGDRVASMVYALSKNKKPTNVSKQTSSISHPRKTRMGFYLLRLERVGKEEPGVIFIKMADQIDNLDTINVFPMSKQERKIQEIKDDFLPMYERVANSFKSSLRRKYEKLRAILVAEIVM
jgi:GTP diphosphokinase / guanosine-3',5'-bis(diphosphate) 3'-diphosphatase